ncbi:hypothetical protein QTG54_016031 [Skeletonema marinoi]|uniref:Cellulase n=1 Tax=Skeletonema marinoi TaxID=267567 RepID=A0AAD8XT09_9STRA|nr:hypothetical protein QTG54_016031 [Skeletonema marinoi]
MKIFYSALFSATTVVALKAGGKPKPKKGRRNLEAVQGTNSPSPTPINTVWPTDWGTQGDPTPPPRRPNWPTYSPTPPTSTSSSCTGSTPGWTDIDGDGCDWYEMNDSPGCPLYGDSHVGELGSANENCCYCFSTDVVTPSLCEGTPEWTDVWGDGCEWYEANDQPGCSKYGMNWEGDMGFAIDNCCFCSETAVVTNSTGGAF